MSFLLSQDTFCRRPSARRAVAESSVCCASSAQIKGSTGLAHLDHTVPLRGLRVSAQLKCEGAVLFTRFVAASLGVLLMLSKSPPDLWSWPQGPWSGCLAPDRQKSGQVSGPREEQNKGNIQVPERVAYTTYTSSLIVSGIKVGSLTVLESVLELLALF